MTDTKTTALEQKISELAPWFHNLHLPDGTQTAPDHFLGDFPDFKWRELAPFIPQDLTGWRALDIGCNAGFYSFELARRGARVLVIDCDRHYLEQARWAAQQYGLEEQVEFRLMQIYDLAREAASFDLVLFIPPNSLSPKVPPPAGIFKNPLPPSRVPADWLRQFPQIEFAEPLFFSPTVR